jgi:hypothetical protein
MYKVSLLVNIPTRGKIAKALEERSSGLFSQSPDMERLVLAAKMPEVVQ